MSDNLGNFFGLIEELHLTCEADAIVDGRGLVQEIELDLPDSLYFIEYVVLNTPIFDYMCILEDGFDDSFIFCQSLFGKGDVNIKVGERAIELVIV